MPVAGGPVSREHREPGRRALRRLPVAGGLSRAASLAVAALALSVIPGANDAAYAQQASASAVPVPFAWDLKPAGLTAGDRFRLLFITHENIRPITTKFDDYDEHVQNAIANGHADIRKYARHFGAVVSTSTVDARDHIGATGNGVPIHWLNGHRAASDYADFFDSVISETPKDETGRNSTGGDFWTGSNDDGTKYDDQWVGSQTVRYGNLNLGLDYAGSSYIYSARLLGISSVFRVLPRGVPYVTGLTISSAPNRGRSYRTGETVKVTVTYSEAVTVDSTGGTPQLALTIGRDTRNARYSSAESTTTALVFAYTVVEEDYDDNGISISSRGLTKNGGSIKRRQTQTDADLFVIGLNHQADHRVNYSGIRRLVLSAASLEVAEGGGAGYTVKLAARPSGPVTVTLGGTSGTDLSLDRTSLGFTASNWNVAQAVRVSASDDDDGADDTATLTHTASGGGYDGISQNLPVTVEDDDEAGLVLSAASLEVPEGGSVGYTVKLATQPAGPVTVTLGGTAGTDLSSDRTSLTFAVSNWNTAQTVTLSAGDDADAADDTATLTHTASGGGYGGVSKHLPVTVNDDDEAGLVLSAASLEVPEGGNVDYRVKLATRPSGPVTVTLGGTADTDLSLDETSLTFAPETWDTAQTVTVSAGDDADGADDTATLTHVASGGGYGGVSKRLPVTVIDDDELALVLSAASLEVPEAGDVDYTVKLATRPTGPVTVTFGGTAGTDLSLDKTSLSFTVANWNAAQSVTVTGADDDAADHTATLTHVASGGGYGGVSKRLPVTVIDDDEPDLVLSVSIAENADATYTVKLATRPSGPVTVTLGGTAGTDLSLGETSLSFTVANWNAAQTVTVSAADDADGADDTATLTHSASGGGYGAVSKNLQVRVTDDDEAGLVLSVSSLGIAENADTTYTVP